MKLCIQSLGDLRYLYRLTERSSRELLMLADKKDKDRGEIFINEIESFSVDVPVTQILYQILYAVCEKS